jgi:hypothetical protein
MPSLYLDKDKSALPAVWLSPSLSVVKLPTTLNQDGGTPLLDIDPAAGESQNVVAQAGNDSGATIADVHVQLWALAFGTATVPSLFLTSMGGTKGAKVPASPVGTSIANGLEQSFPRPWNKDDGLTSTDPEITARFVGGDVHCCILGNVYSPNDPGSAEIPDSPGGPVLNVAGERRHAQHNMTIKAHNTARSLAFHLYAGNPDPEREEIATLEIRERVPRKLQTWELRQLDALGPWIRRTKVAHPGGIPGLEILAGRKAHAVLPSKAPLKGLELHIPGAKGSGPKRAIELGAHQAQRMTIAVPKTPGDFVLRVLDITQTQRGKPVGGARLMLMNVPQELLAKR